MAQLLVREVPEEVKERLKRRAIKHGRSLEAEVRDILANVPEPLTSKRDKSPGIGALLVKKQRRLGVARADIDELNRNIAELRSAWRMRDVKVEK